LRAQRIFKALGAGQPDHFTYDTIIHTCTYRNKSVIVFWTDEYGSVGLSISAHAQDSSSTQLRSLTLGREEEHEGKQNQKPLKKKIQAEEE
jgi:hypothetical protein